MAIAPRQLGPTQLCRLLNSTPLGEVISERQLHRHRTRAGFRITAQLLSRAWHKDSGTTLFIERCLIDANWGHSTEVIYRFCRQSAHPAVVTPSHGRFVGASSKPFSDYERRVGERVGWNWRLPAAALDRPVRHVVFDANFWKSFVQARLAVAIGDRGGLTCFGTEPAGHRLLAEHLTAEYPVPTSGRGRTVEEWKVRPDRPDNHWLDCLVGCAVAASMEGTSLLGEQPRGGVRPTVVIPPHLIRGRAR